MIPSFHPTIDRVPFAPLLASIDLAGSGALAGHGQRFIALGERLESMIEGYAHDLLVDASTALNAAAERGLAKARVAGGISAAALQHWRAVMLPEPRIDPAIIWAELEAAEKALNEALELRLRTMRRSATAEVARLLGAWRAALDRAAESIDASERERAEQAYSAAARIDIDAAWPRIVFQEIGQ